MEQQVNHKFQLGDQVIMIDDGSSGTVVAMGKLKIIVGSYENGCYVESIFDIDSEHLNLKPKEITVTKVDLIKAWNKTDADTVRDHIMFTKLCKELGF